MQNKKLTLLLLVFLIFTNPLKAETINLSCEFEYGKDEFIVNEKNKTIKRGVLQFFNYRSPKDENKKVMENIFINEMVDFRMKSVIRYKLDLNTLKDHMTIVLIADEDLAQVKQLSDKFKNGKIQYSVIDKYKQQLFDRYWVDPKDFDGRKRFDWRKDEWYRADPNEYLLFRDDHNNNIFQALMISFCEFKF